MSNQPTLRILCFCFILALAGCNSDGLVTLKGKVTVDGAPAPAGISLQFQPLSEGSPSYAITDADGNYEAEFSFSKKGIMVGKHRVSFIPGGGGGGDEGDSAAASHVKYIWASKKMLTTDTILTRDIAASPPSAPPQACAARNQTARLCLSPCGPPSAPQNRRAGRPRLGAPRRTEIAAGPDTS